MSMNNFDLPIDELFCGQMTIFGAKSTALAELDPMSNQGRLVDMWPDWIYETQSAKSVRAVALLTNLLFPKNVDLMEFAELGEWTFNVTMAGIEGIRQWLTKDTESDAFVGINENGKHRWAMVGVSPNLSLGMIAIEHEFPGVGYSIDSVTKTIVQIAPIRDSFLEKITDLRPNFV